MPNTSPGHGARTAAVLSIVLAAGAAACKDATNAATGALATATGPSYAVDARTTTDCTKATQNPAKVVCLANAFLATLTQAQKDSALVTLSATNAVRWSNLPCGITCRNGILFGQLNKTQLTAALNVAKAALSSAGYSQEEQHRIADSILATASGGGGGPPGGGSPPGGGTPPGGGSPPSGTTGGSVSTAAYTTSGYGAGVYVIAFLGTPSTTGKWILQLGGHHLAINLAYNGAATPIPTPYHIGIEPQVFTVNGVTYKPLQANATAMYTLINSLNSTQYTAASLSATYSDLLLGAGSDARSLFPSPRQGIPGYQLTAAQRQLVKNAIEVWVKDFPSLEASNTLAAYEDSAALDSTYVASAGGRDSTKQGSYIRIDGPRVWIEFVCQNGVVYSSQIHFHTIWRDRQYDYGGFFSL